MFLTITTTHPPATDLGFLLHKHPERAQSFGLSNGVTHVFYPEANDDRCTAALLAALDPVALVRGHKAGVGLAQYVNDRPYAAGSQFAVALRAVFGTALSGRCDARPELATTPIPLELRLPSVSAAGGAGRARHLFEPLGWEVTTTEVPLDERIPGSGASRYLDLRLAGVQVLAYLAYSRPLVDSALTRLAEADDITPDSLDDALATPIVTAAPSAPEPLAAYVDPALAGFDAAVLMEVIEHIDEPRLPAMERAVFGAARPRTVIVTTPNSEYNVRFEGLAHGRFRHGDHRFEWDRARFGQWTEQVAGRYSYQVRLLPVGAQDPDVGPPTQLAVFTKHSEVVE